MNKKRTGPSRALRVYKSACPTARALSTLPFLFLLALTLASGVLPAQAQQAPAPPAQAPAPTYDGEWWLTLGGWEQYGFLSGYEDCYAFEYRGSVPFTKEIQSYIDDLNKYFLADPGRSKETVSQALDALRGARGDKGPPADSGEVPASAHGGFDGKFWFDADPAAELGFVEGYVACHEAKLKDADGKFSKSPSEYVGLINKAYDITDDTDDVDPEKAPIKIADILHRLKDEETPPAKPGSAAVYLPSRVSASLSLISAWRVTPIRLASRSIALNSSRGKSTFTRWTSRPGRLACVKSTCALRSFPESCKASSSAAVSASVGDVPRRFFPGRAADGDDADRFIAVGYKG